MGTNFYIAESEKFFHDFINSEESSFNLPEGCFHIGKRSAAGKYCYDCKMTLCCEGEEGIHFSKSKWYDTCPKCGKSFVMESLEHCSMGKELGFNKKNGEKKSGVKSCSSFSWAISSIDFEKKAKNKKNIIFDEYGTRYSFEDFKVVLEDCAVKYTRSIGQEFR